MRGYRKPHIYRKQQYDGVPDATTRVAQVFCANNESSCVLQSVRIGTITDSVSAIVSDGRRFIDFGRDSSGTPLIRNGDGPGEVRMPMALRLGNNATVHLFDLNRMRYLVVSRSAPTIDVGAMPPMTFAGVRFEGDKLHVMPIPAAARVGDSVTAVVMRRSTWLPPAPRDKRKKPDAKTAGHRPKIADDPIPANPFGVAAIRLLALTGCRENEILSLPWAAVDFERGYLRLSDTKTGKSNRPLPQSTAAVLHALPQFENNPFVLPGAKPGEHLKEIKRLWNAVRHTAKLTVCGCMTFVIRLRPCRLRQGNPYS